MMIIRHCLTRFFCCLIAPLVLGMALSCPVAAQLNQKVPIHIEADRMTSLEKKRAVVFSGNVKAVQGELQINSDEMTVYHGEAAGGEGSGQEQPQIEKMLARGRVEIIQADFVATGDEAEYFSATGKAVITGNAKIIQNNNMVTGHRVEMDLGEGTTVIVPDEKKNGRVVGYFYPGSADSTDDAGTAIEAGEVGGTEDVEGVSGDGGPAGETLPEEQRQQDKDHGDTGN